MLATMTLFIPVTAVTVQSQGSFLSAFDPELRDKFSGVVLAGAPTGAPGGPAVSGPLALGADVIVSGANTSPQNEPEIAAESWVDGFPHAAGANDYGTGTGDARCGAYFSLTGGNPPGWSRIAAGGGAIPHPPALVALALNVSGDPDLAYGKERLFNSLSGFPVLYYSCLAFSRATGSGSIFVSRSLNGGASYSSADGGIVATGSASVFNDKEFLAVDTGDRSPKQGSVYVCWTEFGPSGAVIKFRRSTTQAIGWGPVVTISSPLVGPAQGCDLAVGPSGRVYVTWLYFTTNLCNGTIKVRRSDNGGSSFAAEVTVASVSKAGACSLPGRAGIGAYRLNNFPRIATDRLGHVGIVAASDGCYTVSGVLVCSVGLDIWFFRSSATATSWSFIRRVNNTRTTLDQHWPVLKWADNSPGMTATSHGTPHVCYIDRSFAATAGDWDTACAHSHNDGSTWPLVQRVSDSSSFDGQFGGGFIGDYIGLAISGLGGLATGHVHPAFPRNTAAGEMDIYSENATPTAPPGGLAPAGSGGP